MQVDKHLVLMECKKVLDEKIRNLLVSIDEIKDSLQSDTKSSVGDKHETSRAHLQLEQEKIGQQLYEWEQQRSIIEKHKPSINSGNIGIGSFVETNYGYFYILCNLGKIKVGEMNIMVISPQSPLAISFMKSDLKTVALKNGTVYSIVSFC